MTTQVQERVPTPALRPGRPRSARGSWIVFLTATILAALAIGIVAALLGNAVKAVTDASGLLGTAQSAYQSAQVNSVAASDAEAAAKAELEAQRQAVIDELSTQELGTMFSIGTSAPAFAEVRALEASIEQNETAAVRDALLAEENARTGVQAADAKLVEAQQSVEAVTAPFWIVTIVSGIVLLLLAAIAILRTIALRRR